MAYAGRNWPRIVAGSVIWPKLAIFPKNFGRKGFGINAMRSSSVTLPPEAPSPQSFRPTMVTQCCNSLITQPISSHYVHEINISSIIDVIK
jgi:hypothetical protein